MHSEDGDDDGHKISGYYGIWPGVFGAVIAGGLIWFMFALADGFA
ncbi:MAG: hypothetical protein AAFP68_22630 [Pseudomonadota bacterium]